MVSNIVLIFFGGVLVNYFFLCVEGEKCAVIGKIMADRRLNHDFVLSFDSSVAYEKSNNSIWEVVSKIRPDWKKSKFHCKTLENYYKNKFSECSGGSKEDVVLVKIYEKETDLLNSKNEEMRNHMYLYSYGYATEVLGEFPNGYIFDPLTGNPLTADNMGQEDIYPLIAKSTALFHRADIPYCGKKKSFMWNQILTYLKLAPEKYSDPKKQKSFQKTIGSKENIMCEFQKVKNHLKALKSPIKFCHNDLSPGNIYYDNRTNSVTFGNFEPSGYNHRAFEIADHFAEFAGIDSVDFSNGKNDDFKRQWIRTYLETYRGKQKGAYDCEKGNVTDKQVERLLVEVKKFELASHFLWGSWGLYHSEDAYPPTKDFDYFVYAISRFDQYFKTKDELLSLKVPK